MCRTVRVRDCQVKMSMAEEDVKSAISGSCFHFSTGRKLRAGLSVSAFAESPSTKLLKPVHMMMGVGLRASSARPNSTTVTPGMARPMVRPRRDGSSPNRARAYFTVHALRPQSKCRPVLESDGEKTDWGAAKSFAIRAYRADCPSSGTLYLRTYP